MFNGEHPQSKDLGEFKCGSFLNIFSLKEHFYRNSSLSSFSRSSTES